ncbi:MAG: hypothetical protein NTU49_04505, partial [Gammaproteobacteria bacterium]|nr:hypothetical protein [Gammaproteobacteria bacterium]
GALLCVQNGADLSIRNKIKKTSIQLAADNSHWKTIIEVLKYSETGVNDTFKCGYALLLMARTKSWAPCHALLNQKNIRLDFQEPNTLLFKEKAAWTALNYFVEAGQDALIALCAARTDAFLSKQNDFIIPEDAKAAYELALANNDCALLEMLNNSDNVANVAYFINWASYGAAVGNHLDLLAYLTDEGADKKFISAGKIKGLKKTPVTNPHVFLPAPTSNSYESGHSFKSLEHGL